MKRNALHIRTNARNIGKLVRYLALFLVISLIVTMSIKTEASEIQSRNSGFAQKIENLKKIYRHGEYWNIRNGLNKTGTKICLCNHVYCGYNCQCGYFQSDGETGAQCHGFAMKMMYLTIGGSSNTYKQHTNSNKIYAGDLVRIDDSSHSIFITRVSGDTIYYADCNATGKCQVNWNGVITRSELRNRLTYIRHKPGNTNTGNDEGPVKPAPPKTAAKSVSLNKKSLTLYKGKTYTLKAKVNPGNYKGGLSWSSSNRNTTVTKSGKLTANKAGKSTITVKTNNNKRAYCSVIVKEIKSRSVVLNKKNLTIYKGKKYTLKATVKPANSTDSKSWSTSNKKYATVTSRGTITAVRKGSCNITVKMSSGKKAVCKVTIK